jgi:hypothetical protein
MDIHVQEARKSTSKELKALGVSFVDRELLFVTEHPEFRNLTPHLRGVYSTCQARILHGGGVVELDEAYEHFQTCDWCQRHFEYHAEPLRKLLGTSKKEGAEVA